MPKVPANGVELFYDSHGLETSPPLLLVMGLGAQLTAWDVRLVEWLVAGGVRVLRFDNRDAGLSTHLDGVPANLSEVMGGDAAKAPYLLTDLAKDIVALLDALGIPKAHVVGASMGGMIAQTLAIEHSARVQSLGSIMSSTGDPTVGQATDEARAILMSPPAADRAGAIERGVASARIFGSRTYPPSDDALRTRLGLFYDRAYYPEGMARQLAAIYASPDRTEALKKLNIPTVVIHGDEDSLIVISGGMATSEAIPGARFVRVLGMGHDLPPPLYPEILNPLLANIARA